MTDILSLAIVILSLICIIFLIYLTNKYNAVAARLEVLDKTVSLFDKILREEFSNNRKESAENSKTAREELNNSFKHFSSMLSVTMRDNANQQKIQLDFFARGLTNLTNSLDDRLEKMRKTIEERISGLQIENAKKLDEMRNTVDEKLQSTLEKRLGESFREVSERLEAVYKGLGDMQNLAKGVGDLKNVLSNVKTRGVLGEIQLGSILEQILTNEQYSTNVRTNESYAGIVEFAVKLPGRDDQNKTVWLPIDSKFPIEDYQSLLDAYEQSDPTLIDGKTKLLANKIKAFAKDIRDKYLDPPNTTDFAIMFLPVEGLYAEVLRNTGLFEQLQREYKVIVTGPTTISALLNSLQMGFRTLAIEKRSSEVWELLGAVKTEFGNFGDVLKKTQKKLQEASNVIDQAGRKTRAIERKLRDVQQMPALDSAKLLGQEFDHTPEEDSEEFEENFELPEN